MANETLSEIVASCDQEPIHALGLVQPHGALLCLDQNGCLIAASTNASALLGPLPLLGEPLSDAFLNPLACQTIFEAFADPAKPTDAVECDGANGERFDIVTHWSGDTLVVEFEQLSANAPPPSQFALYAQRAIQRLQTSQFAKPRDLLQAAAEIIRTMTGFDRVMAYRFLSDGSGEVIGEARRDDLSPYLQQRYPAGDIPAQARRLYVLNPIRQIASVQAVPVTIEPSLHPHTHAPYDLSYAVLRSVSPIHIEYLKNMGVSASMSVSIVLDGQLWGLLACHHMSPHRASHAVRLSCTVLTQVVAILLSQIEARQRSLDERRVHDLRARIATALAQADEALMGLLSAADDVAALIDCECVMAVVDHEVVALGSTRVSHVDALRTLAEHMTTTRQDTLITQSLTDELPHLPAITTSDGQMAGCLAIQMVGDSRITIVWLRGELVETINWAGPPDKVIASGPNGARLTPRGSFEVWKQTVRGRSREWSGMDKSAARELKVILQDVALQRMREAERARTTLLATLGHDLRDPLQAINMAVQLMGRGLATSNDTAKRVEGSTRRMQSLINYILDVSRIRSGVGLGLTRERVGLGELLESIAEQNRQAHPNITIVTELAPDLGDVFVDSDRFNQALTNLISNARQHGDTSYPIEVAASDESGAKRIEVRNRLIKKPVSSFERLTDPFKSGSLDNPSNRGGLGLGLYIAGAIIKGHDATFSGSFGDTSARIVITFPDA